MGHVLVRGSLRLGLGSQFKPQSADGKRSWGFGSAFGTPIPKMQGCPGENCHKCPFALRVWESSAGTGKWGGGGGWQRQIKDCLSSSKQQSARRRLRIERANSVIRQAVLRARTQPPRSRGFPRMCISVEQDMCDDELVLPVPRDHILLQICAAARSPTFTALLFAICIVWPDLESYGLNTFPPSARV